MKVDIKDLQKALDRARKDGVVTVDIKADNTLCIKADKIEISYAADVGDTVIRLPQSGSQLFSEITYTARF